VSGIARAFLIVTNTQQGVSKECITSPNLDFLGISVLVFDAGWVLMRNRLTKFLPIVLIALMVQVLAPIAASWAAAMVAADRFGASDICHSLPASDSAQSDQNTDHRTHDGACPICCVAQASASLDTPQAVVVTMPYREVARVVWHDQTFRLARSSIGSNAQARAPPLSV
jgi:hypothetical protein